MSTSNVIEEPLVVIARRWVQLKVALGRVDFRVGARGTQKRGTVLLSHRRSVSRRSRNGATDAIYSSAMVANQSCQLPVDDRWRGGANSSPFRAIYESAYPALRPTRAQGDRGAQGDLRRKTALPDHGRVGRDRKSAPRGRRGRPAGDGRLQPPLLTRGQQVKEFFATVREPLTISFRFNAGAIPADHWTQDEEIGGGRIIGEACHGIDLATFLCGSPPVRVYAESVGGPERSVLDDQCFITLRHANGSVSNIAYLAGGDKAFPKERIEVFGGGRRGGDRRFPHA